MWDRGNGNIAFYGNCLALLLICLAVGAFAVALNLRFYEHHQPFHDSLGYHDKLLEVITLGQEQGVLAALGHACQCNSTVFIPNAVAALLSPLVHPSRLIGVWIQVAELAAVLLSLFYYVTRVRRQSNAIGLMAVAPLLILAGLYRYNGGLSDFRMDLSLCLMFSLTVIWYLAAIATQRLGHFLLLGAAAGVACLFRATAPVYLAMALGPLIVLDLATARNRSRLARGFLLSALVAVTGSLWFYLLNFDRLHYYYFVWNTHANASLPIHESLRHVDFALNHVGDRALLMVAGFHIVIAIQRFLIGDETLAGAMQYCRQHPTSGDVFYRLPVLDWINYRLLWIAMIPTLFLILRGAGLNPFVSMPSAIGLVLFLLFPMNMPVIRLSKPAMALATIIFVSLIGRTWLDGWEEHGPGACDSMSAHQKILNSALADARQQGLKNATVASLHVFSMDTRSLRNACWFDIPGVEIQGSRAVWDGVKFHFAASLAPVAQANWEEVQGRNDQEKLQTICSQIRQRVKYLVLPNPESARFVADHAAHNVINRFCPAIREQLLQSGEWVAITAEIENAPHDTVQLFARRDTVRTAKREEPAPQHR